jgi:hypothetical protein
LFQVVHGLQQLCAGGTLRKMLESSRFSGAAKRAQKGRDIQSSGFGLGSGPTQLQGFGMFSAPELGPADPFGHSSFKFLTT